jgi:hypothetical protein
MATATLSPSPSFPQFTITAEEIARYAELTSLLTQLEKQKEQLRAELLELHDDGAQQEETGPYLLAFTDQERRHQDVAVLDRDDLSARARVPVLVAAAEKRRPQNPSLSRIGRQASSAQTQAKQCRKSPANASVETVLQT